MRRLRTIAACALAMAWATPALADTRGSGTDNKTIAEMLFYTARGLLEADKVSAACEKFAESYRLDATPGTLLNLAVCHEKEGKLASAWGEFREAIADAQKANRPDREELARDRVKAIEPELPMVTLEVPKAARVKGVQVFRNGGELAEGAWDTPIPADPGVVTFELRAPGFYPVTKEVTVAKRQHLTVTLDAPRPMPVVAPAEPFFTPRRTLGAVIGGVGLAAVGVGAAFGVMALNDVKTSNASCPVYEGQRRCDSVGAQAMSQASTHGWVSTIALIGGGLAVGTGVYFLVTKAPAKEGATAPASAERAETKASWGYGVAPTVGGGRAVLFGSF